MLIGTESLFKYSSVNLALKISTKMLLFQIQKQLSYTLLYTLNGWNLFICKVW